MDQTTLRIILGVIGVVIIAIIVLRRKKRKG
jgi:LPXTG-motif cell wall-anchored protein